VSKKDIAVFLQENGSIKFQMDNKVKMSVKNVTKNKTKDQLIALYNELFETKAFKKDGEEAEFEQQKMEKLAQEAEKLQVKDKASDGPAAAAEPPKYTKRILKKDKSIALNTPKKGETVYVHYTGKLEDGTVFDSSYPQDKKLNAKSLHKIQPLKFKVGVGKVIKGWDECLMTMTVGEKAEVIIEPEWAYGKKGLEKMVDRQPVRVIPPNATLTFEMELMNIE